MTPAATPPRIAAHPVESLILDRWSPRAFDQSALAHDDMMSLFEAARWAPSSMNAQPWRFLYALRDTPAWARFLDVLLPFNRMWAQNASLGLLVLSDTLMQPNPEAEPKPSHSHSFDAGAAWGMLSVQATSLGLSAHGMTGVNFDKARELFEIPDRLRVECAIVVGRRADKSILSEQHQAREIPSGRKPVEQFAFEGELPEALRAPAAVPA